jgi:hypothetical protein
MYGQTNALSDKDFETIFNGENWDGWNLKIRSGDEELASQIFSIEDGMVHVYKYMPDSSALNTRKCATHGLFYTQKKYSKYIFKFEYKWGEKIVNNFDQWQYDAGFYYHVAEDAVWPKGIEYQVRYNHLTHKNHTGDLIISGVKAQWYSNDNKEFCLPGDGGTAKTHKGWMFLADPDVEYNALNSKWNQCEIIVMADKYSIHKLNGKIVNIASNLSVSEGIIGLQAETAELFYRNIQIKEFDELIPMEKFLTD